MTTQQDDDFIQYYNDDINEWILSEKDEQIVKSIESMGWNQLLAARNHINNTLIEDPAFQYSREKTIACKCIIHRAEFLKQRGLDSNQKIGFFDLVYEGMVGYIIGNEFCRRIGL